MPQLNFADFGPQLIWLAITFIALYLLMARVALPRIGEVIEERRDRIQRDLDEADRLKNETERALASYEKALAEARSKAHGIAQENRDRLNKEVEAERSDVESQIAAKTADAEAQIVKAKEAAMSRVSEVASETAEAILTEVIGLKASADDIKAAVDSSAKQA